MPLDRQRLGFGECRRASPKNEALPLHWAVWRGNVAIDRLLVDQLIDPNEKDKDGQTPLMWAGLKEADTINAGGI